MGEQRREPQETPADSGTPVEKTPGTPGGVSENLTDKNLAGKNPEDNETVDKNPAPPSPKSPELPPIQLQGGFAYKVGMSQVYDSGGRVVPVTVLRWESWRVSQLKTREKEGYSAVQIAGGSSQKVKKCDPTRVGSFEESRAGNRGSVGSGNSTGASRGNPTGPEGVHRELFPGGSGSNDGKVQGSGFCRGHETVEFWGRASGPRVHFPPATGVQWKSDLARSGHSGKEISRSLWR